MEVGLIISLILSSLLAIGSGVGSFVSQKKQNDRNDQLYEDWKSYNSPVSQMERLEDAGLNKYLVSNVNNTMSQPFSVGLEDSGSLFKGLSSAAGNIANHFQTGLSREVQRESLEVKRDDLEIKKESNAIRMIIAQNAVETGDYQRALLALNADAQELQNMFNSETYDTRKYALELQNSLTQSQIENLGSRKQLTDAQKEFITKQINMYDKLVQSQIANNYSNVNYREAYIDYLNSQLTFYKDKFRKEHYTLSEWQQQQIDNWLARNGISKDYYNLAETRLYWNVIFGGIDAATGIANVGTKGMKFTK